MLQQPFHYHFPDRRPWELLIHAYPENCGGEVLDCVSVRPVQFVDRFAVHAELLRHLGDHRLVPILWHLPESNVGFGEVLALVRGFGVLDFAAAVLQVSEAVVDLVVMRISMRIDRSCKQSYVQEPDETKVENF